MKKIVCILLVLMFIFGFAGIGYACENVEQDEYGHCGNHYDNNHDCNDTHDDWFNYYWWWNNYSSHNNFPDSNWSNNWNNHNNHNNTNQTGYFSWWNDFFSWLRG